MATLTIGQVAKQVSVGIDTVRYYEREGLLAPAGRMPSGYRRYGAHEIARLRFIRRAKSLGFSLDEIRELLALGDGRDIAKVRRTAQDKLADVDRRIAELRRMRDGLAELIAACPGHGRAEACPILIALSKDES